MNTKNKKRSLRTKLMLAALMTLLVLSVILGCISSAVVSNLAEKDSRQLMTKTCEEKTLRFDNQFELVSHSVEMIHTYANILVDHSSCKVYSDEYTEAVKEFALSVANKTEGAMAVYLRYNPQITGSGTSGFFWSRKDFNEGFKEEKTTDILAYNSTDIEHVGWYYESLKKGEPLWMAPYYNKNIDVSMISYIIPFYLENGEFVGVIGIDIDFNTILTTAGHIRLYKTGKLALINLSERMAYYSNGKSGINEERLSSKLYNHVTTINKTSDILEMTDENYIVNLSCCERLSNGMMLYVSVPKKEIYAKRDSLIVVLIILTLITMLVTFLIFQRYTSQIVLPIKKIAEVTGKYAEGNWSESYICETGDEIQELSEGISTMAKNTQVYIDKIRNIATTDALTGVGNTTAYVKYVNQIKENANGRYDNYSVTVMDLNLLKKANDTYGHKAGDALITEASRYICNSFVHSAVFRVGGDDHSNIKELCKKFEANMNYKVEAANDIPLSIAFGTSSCPQDSKEFDKLLKLADKKMYSKKKEMKMGRSS